MELRVEFGLWSLNRDNAHSWVRISHGSKRFVMNLNNNEQEIPEVQLEESALKIECRWFCKPINGQSKTTKNEILPAHPQELYLLGKELGPMLNLDSIQSPIMKCQRDWFVFFVREIYLEKKMERLNSGESKMSFRNISSIVNIGLTTSGRKAWQEEEETRKDSSTVLIRQE